jgi:hypothetical protein
MPARLFVFTAQPGAVRPGEPVLFSYGRMHTTVKPGDRD